MGGRLPKGWKRVRLGDVCTVNPRADSLKGVKHVSFVAMADVSTSGKLTNQTVLPASKEVVSGYTRFRRGDILCAKITPCFENGKGASTEQLETEQGIGSTEFHVIRPNGPVSPELVHAIVQTSEFRKRGELWMTGSAGQRRAPADYISEYEVTLPQLDEQRRIVSILNSCDDLALHESALLTAQRVRYDRRLLQAFAPLHLEAGCGWLSTCFSDAFYERDERSGDLPLLAITGDQGVVPRDELERRDTSAADKSKYKVIRKGDIGYNTMRMWQGVCGLSQYDGVVSPAYTVVTPDESRILGRFAAHLFRHPRVIHTFHRYSQGLVDDTLMLKYPHFSEISLPIPGLAEQRRIADLLDAQLELVEQQRRMVNLREQQKRGFMQKLLTGEWRLPRDLPDPEAADVGA